MLYPPQPWTNQKLRLYHGTLEQHALSISSAGVRVALGRTHTDFGRGFYTTTLERQAQTWAYQAAQKVKGGRAAVVAFDVDREHFATLDVLTFVRGSFDAEDFWSVVAHCRGGGVDHGRTATPSRWYDVVVGPVASSWRQRLVIADADQVSFHTSAAEILLHESSRSVTWIQSP